MLDCGQHQPLGCPVCASLAVEAGGSFTGKRFVIRCHECGLSVSHPSRDVALTYWQLSALERADG